MYISRSAEGTLHELAVGYPVLAVTGPRQSGKTTLVRHAFPNHEHVSLEDIDQREFADSDPRGFLSQFSTGVILDEAQRCPQLFSYIQGQVDEHQRAAEYVLTGSQQFGLLSGITQSLAGRSALVNLLPLELTELKTADKLPPDLNRLLFDGGYPPLYDRTLDPHRWYANYVRTYLERDVRLLINVHDLGKFQRFLRLCAARTGQLLNLSSLATDCGITHNTAKSWISVLQASYIVHLLPPHHQNFNKRLVKTPKLYFLDTGLASWLLGIQNHEQLAIHPSRGALFETWIVSEFLKARYNQALESNLFFWRDRSGHEVDILLELGTELGAIEIKSGQTVNRDFFKGLEYWRTLTTKAPGPLWLVYGGRSSQSRTGIKVVPWNELEQIDISNSG